MFTRLMILGWLGVSGVVGSKAPALPSGAGTAQKMEPTIVSQKAGGPGRAMIEVQNPVDGVVSVYLDCPGSAVSAPVNLGGHSTVVVNVPSSEPRCLIRRYSSGSKAESSQTSSRPGSSPSSHRRTQSLKLRSRAHATPTCRAGQCGNTARQTLEARARHH